MPAATLVAGAGVAGVHLADPALNRVALFSAAHDASAPAGATVPAYMPTTHLYLPLVGRNAG